MINNNTIRRWFRTAIDTSTDIDITTQIAWVNRDFDSSNLDYWYRERYQVADEGINGNESNLKTGLIYYDLICRRGFGDDTAEDLAEALATVFEPTNRKEQEVESGLKIDIDEATTGVGGSFQETDYLIPIRILFRAYETE